MVLSLEFGDIAVVVAELQAARRMTLERADSAPDEASAACLRGAAERYQRIVDTMTGSAHRWHEMDIAQRSSADARMATAG